MLGNNIKQMRLNKAWSQEELAQSLHTSRQTISKWENGISVPDANTLINIATLFDTNVASILGENIKEDISMSEISNKLEVLNSILARRENRQRNLIRNLLIGFLLIGLIKIILYALFAAVSFDF